jgi:hypothetical protein
MDTASRPHPETSTCESPSSPEQNQPPCPRHKPAPQTPTETKPTWRCTLAFIAMLGSGRQLRLLCCACFCCCCWWWWWRGAAMDVCVAGVVASRARPCSGSA